MKGKPLSRVRLLATPWTAAYQAPPSMGFFQARVLEWGAIAFSEIICSSSMKNALGISNFLEQISAAAKSLQLCPTLRDPIDSSPPGSPIPGILQARTLE